MPKFLKGLRQSIQQSELYADAWQKASRVGSTFAIDSRSSWEERGTVTIRKSNISVRGEGHRIELHDGVQFRNVDVEIWGRGHHVILEEGVSFKRGGGITLYGEGCTLRIGKGTTIEGAVFSVGENGNTLSVGEDCMFSYDIEVRTSDAHSIVDLKTNRRTNPPADVTLGDHVWVAASVTIMKGVEIGAHSVIGTRSLVTKSVPPNAIAVGAPAKVLKEGVTWDRDRLPY